MADAAEVERIPAAARSEQPEPSKAEGAADQAGRTRSLPRALIAEARPKQWIKNLLVFAAPAAAGVLRNGPDVLDTLIAFVAFCLAASGTYFLNDAYDVEADRRHARKRFRPVAVGDLTVNSARVVGVVLMLAGIGVGFLTGWKLPVVIGCYVILTTTYTMWFKHVAVVDLAVVAAGFVLRMIAGAVAVDVRISVWFFIVGSFGSLFMVAGKRHAEYLELGTEAASHRATLSEYSTEYLGYVRAVASGVAMMGYCLWAFEKSQHLGGVPWYELSIVPFVLAMLRYALLVERGEGGAPEELVLRDRPLQIIGLVWAITVAIGLYVA
jgi:decaprenyl-phosphate phosphoribosyltransferase